MAVLWTWIGGHQRAVQWLSGAAAFLLLAGGVALGVGRATIPQSSLAEAPLQAQPLAARVPASRHSVVGVVRAVGPSEMLVRSPRGVFFAIRWGAGAHFRAAGREIRPAALRTGDTVIVIGKPSKDGSLVASYVTILRRPSAAAEPPSSDVSSP